MIAEELIELTLNAIKTRNIELPFPKKLPGTFQELTNRASPLSKAYQGCKSGFNSDRVLFVIASVCLEDDNLLWYHASISRKNGLIPGYTDLEFLKKYWIGDNNWCIQVFPEKSKHVSLIDALHLWHCLDKNVIPDFRKFGMI